MPRRSRRREGRRIEGSFPGGIDRGARIPELGHTPGTEREQRTGLLIIRVGQLGAGLEDERSIDRLVELTKGDTRMTDMRQAALAAGRDHVAFEVLPEKLGIDPADGHDLQPKNPGHQVQRDSERHAPSGGQRGRVSKCENGRDRGNTGNRSRITDTARPDRLVIELRKIGSGPPGIDAPVDTARSIEGRENGSRERNGESPVGTGHGNMAVGEGNKALLKTPFETEADPRRTPVRVRTRLRAALQQKVDAIGVLPAERHGENLDIGIPGSAEVRRNGPVAADGIDGALQSAGLIVMQRERDLDVKATVAGSLPTDTSDPVVRLWRTARREPLTAGRWAGPATSTRRTAGGPFTARQQEAVYAGQRYR